MAGAGLAACAAAWAGLAVAQSAEAPAFRSFEPVTDAMLQKPPAADWLSFRRTLNAWGYSPLHQIRTGNVKRLHEVWSVPLRGFMMEATPIIVKIIRTAIIKFVFYQICHNGKVVNRRAGAGIINLIHDTGGKR